MDSQLPVSYSSRTCQEWSATSFAQSIFPGWYRSSLRVGKQIKILLEIDGDEGFSFEDAAVGPIPGQFLLVNRSSALRSLP